MAGAAIWLAGGQGRAAQGWAHSRSIPFALACLTPVTTPRCEEEDVEMGDDAKELLTKIAHETSLRYAIQVGRGRAPLDPSGGPACSCLAVPLTSPSSRDCVLRAPPRAAGAQLLGLGAGGTGLPRLC